MASGALRLVEPEDDRSAASAAAVEQDAPRRAQPARARARRRVMVRGAAASRPALGADQLVALLCPRREPPRRGRWLLLALALHAAVIAGLLALPEAPTPEKVVLVQLLPAAGDAAAGPQSPAAAASAAPAAAPELPKPVKSKRVTPPPAPKPRIAVAPRPDPAPAPAPAPAAPASDASVASPAPPDDGPSAGGAAGPLSGRSAANGRGGTNGSGDHGLAGLDPVYVRRFLASLDRHKHYPRAARARRLEGTTLLWMRMDRSGEVLATKVQESSGHGVLDQAVLQAVRDANPLPPLPASDARAQVELVVPIAFRMR